MSRLRRNLLAGLATTAGAALANPFSPPVLAASVPDGRKPESPSVLDFMSPAMRQDALSGAPMLDHTRAIQAALDSGAAELAVPGGCTFNLTGPLTVGRKTRICGAGELRFSAGIATMAAITVKADGCEFDGIVLTNPNRLQAPAGGRNTGILFRADLGTVTRSTIRGFQNGITVESEGEYHDFIIANNRILDCIGAGGGPGDSTSGTGEDRGDGITIWGCAATITGNLVTAMAGQDCRIGIHVEGLAHYHNGASPRQDNLCTIVGNIVLGPFRRSIVTENLNNASIAGNTCEGATWWGIAVARSLACSITANTVKLDRASTDKSGASWSPIHAGIAVYGGAVQCVISGNTVDLTQGHAAAAILLQGLQTDTVVVGKQACIADGTRRVRLAAPNPTIQVGQLLTGGGVPAQTYVANIDGTTLLASKPIAAGSPMLTVTWHDRGQGIAVTDNSILCNAAIETIGIWAQYQDHPTISGNNIRYMGKVGISCHDVADPVINGNTVLGLNGTKSGIDLAWSRTAAVVVNNVVAGFDAPGAYGINVVNRTGGVVSGNFVRDCATNIHLYGCTGMSVTGNSSVSCASHYTAGSGSGMMLANNASL